MFFLFQKIELRRHRHAPQNVLARYTSEISVGIKTSDVRAFVKKQAVNESSTQGSASTLTLADRDGNRARSRAFPLRKESMLRKLHEGTLRVNIITWIPNLCDV